MLPIIPIVISSISVFSITSLGYYKYIQGKKYKKYIEIEKDIDEWIHNNSKKSNLIHRISRISKSSKE